MLKKTTHVYSRISAAYAGQNRRFLDGGKHVIPAELQHNLVGVSVRHQAADGRQTVHAKLATIVYDDQINSAELF